MDPNETVHGFKAMTTNDIPEEEEDDLKEPDDETYTKWTDVMSTAQAGSTVHPRAVK